MSAVAALAACATPSPKPADSMAWAGGRVWYQIFPERFRNGDPANDPTAADVPESNGRADWRVSPWTSDWYELQPWEVKRSTEFYNDGVVFARRYGGDLKGVIDKLDYLKDLGVEVIYLNPVFESPSLHKYDASSCHHVDAHFGPDPEGGKKLLAGARETEDPSTWVWTKADAEFLRLIKEAHGRGIKVVIDGVFNHTGRGFFAFQDILKNGPRSRYADWYMVNKWGSKPGEEFDYKAWWGFKSLPILARDKHGLLPGPKKYVFDITKRWLAPHGDLAQGVDGFRLDVIEDVPAPFWKEWNAWVKSIKPDAITVGEIWGDASPWVKAGRVDSSMNYPFAKAVASFFVDRKKATSGPEFASALRKMLASYPRRNGQMLLNLVDSHDTDRLASMLRNPDRTFNEQASARDNPSYDVSAPDAAGKLIQKQVAAFQFAFLGAPMVYYGDEAGMWGGHDPDDRKPMVWQDLDYAPEKADPLGRARTTDPVRFDADLHDFYRRLIHLRRENPALQGGDLRFLDQAITPDMVGFSRRAGDGEALALFNRANESRTAVLPVAHAAYRDALSGEAMAPAQGRLRVEVPAHGFRILVSGLGT